MKHRCPWCDRIPSQCWTMPCLMLETSLKLQDETRLARWAKASGVQLQSKSTGKIL